MAAISSLITEIRTDLSDDNSTRFTDTQLLNLIKKALRRCNRIVQRNGIQFGKKKTALTCTSAQSYIDISSTVSDMDVWIGLFKDGTHVEIPKRTEFEWETDSVEASATYCLFDQANSKIYLNGTPTSTDVLTLWYFPKIDPAAYTTATSTPWDGRLDDILMEYASLRAKNIDEMNASFDQALLSDIESQILQAYAPNGVLVTEGSGWL
jgi:hypothetical protein